MKGINTSIRGKEMLTVILAVVAGVFLVMATVEAATTISTNISTAGTLTVSDTSTLTGTVTTGGNLVVGGYATTTGSTGAFATQGAIAASSTLQVTGAVIHYGTVSNIGTVTNSGTVSNTSTVTVGSAGTAISGIQFGFCTATITAVASTTAYASCTGATGVVSGDRIFVQATSSLPGQLVITAASSTPTAGTISLRIQNTGIVGGDVTASVNAINFWAVR